MSAEHEDAVFDHDLDDDDESSQSQDDDDDLENDGVLVVEEDEEDLNSVPSPSTPSPASISLPIAVPSASIVTLAAAAPPNGSADPHKLDYPSALPDAAKRPRLTLVPVFEEQRKPTPTPQPLDKSRQLFQRLWTDEDEIELLQGFFDYTSQRGGGSHHDTAQFYDQIKSKLQLDFNKSQLVEKLRRLKKKYRNVLSKIGSGKEFAFKTPHDQITFEISRKIWSSTGKLASAVEDGNLDDDEGNPNLNNHHHNDGGGGIGEDHKSTPRPKKRSRPRSLATAAPLALAAAPLALTACNGSIVTAVATSGGGGGNVGGNKVDDKRAVANDGIVSNNNNNNNNNNEGNGNAHSNANVNVNVPSLIEETVKSCLSPLFKELLSNAAAAPGGLPVGRGGIGGLAMNAMPLSFGGVEMMGDEKWRKQQILELEVYSKRLELVQDQIRSQLEELRSVGR